MTTRRRLVKPQSVYVQPKTYEHTDDFEDDHKQALLQDDYNNDLPYGGKVYLARRKKPDSWTVFAFEVIFVTIAIGLLIYAYFFCDRLHFHIHHAHAHLGHSHAQHIVAQKYFHGHGVQKNYAKAFHWFRAASDNGHPHASYNLAVAHLKGHKVNMKPGEVRHLIKKAASEGIEQAQHVLDHICTRGHCDNE